MVLDGMTRCGRMFLGLGALLTGCKVTQPHSKYLNIFEVTSCISRAYFSPKELSIIFRIIVQLRHLYLLP